MIGHEKYLCRVCGLSQYPDQPWDDTGELPSHNICDCCGIEFGYEDNRASTEHLARIRQHWIEVENCQWFTPKSKPLNWDMPAQIRGIAAEFAGPDDEKLIEYFLEHQKH
jgi:hypothetical protein